MVKKTKKIVEEEIESKELQEEQDKALESEEAKELLESHSDDPGEVSEEVGYGYPELQHDFEVLLAGEGYSVIALDGRIAYVNSRRVQLLAKPIENEED